MGTNFYTNTSRGRGKHIGKRSAAGAYCWDCRRTLCADGEAYIHYTKIDTCKGCKKYPKDYDVFKCNEPYKEHCPYKREVKWLTKCPSCKKKYKDEEIFEGSVGRELGFNKKSYGKKKGIATCSSFTWAMDREKSLEYKSVKDEYGRKFTMEEFKKILEECPVQYFHMLGQEFS